MPYKDVVAWNAMLQAFADNGDLQSARMIFHQIDRPDPASWSAMIAAYAQHGHLDDARRVFDSIPARLLRRSVVPWNAMLAAIAQLGTAAAAAEALFQRMPQSSVGSWSAVIHACAQNGQGEAALDFFRRMEQRGVEADALAIMGVLAACSHVGSVEEACYYFTSMEIDREILPKLEHYHCMVDALGRSGRMREAEELIHTMPFLPTSISWTTLLGACKIHKNVELAELAAENARRLQLQNIASYVLLSNLIAA
ncbi:hypothetical protein SELMODRAFT_79341 [Selaginella moellendorffii]|uniref:Pentacotripeptide-repeat region of PRORP domain-containing protein n=1 Tax=Selaginella moellendorffii TaxID=88036 RepID=D8QWK5_SELML|nr:hypothetical protein SELMODRAFT_79341 [Selaginella moellendorffii]